MTATVTELFAGRTQMIDAFPLKAEVEYIVTGAADEAAVETAALAGVPTSMTLSGIAVGRMTLEITERINNDTWKVKAGYAQREPNAPSLLENTFAFDTGGQTQHITTSRSNASRTGPKSSDLGGAINFDGDSVNGVDIVVPGYQCTETYWFTDASVTETYKGYLMALTGSVNVATYKGGAAGSVLFMGASGQKRGNGQWEIAFKFSTLPNQTGLSFGSITGIAKKGWQYLWVRYGDDVDNTLKVKIKVPIAVYVENVYPDGDFSLLGIGT